MKPAEALKKLNDRRENELDRFEGEEEILNYLPCDLEFKSVFTHAYRAKVGITFEGRKDWRNQVAELLEQFPPKKLFRYKDSCLSYVPYLDKKEWDRVEAETVEHWEVSPFTISLSDYKAEVIWYSGELQISVEIPKSEYHFDVRRELRRGWDSNGTVYQRDFKPKINGVCYGESYLDSFWRSNDLKPGNYKIHWDHYQDWSGIADLGGNDLEKGGIAVKEGK